MSNKDLVTYRKPLRVLRELASAHRADQLLLLTGLPQVIHSPHGFFHTVVDANRSALDDCCVDTAEVQFNTCVRVHKRGRFRSKSRRELVTATMW
jgi:hypothetical protein